MNSQRTKSKEFKCKLGNFPEWLLNNRKLGLQAKLPNWPRQHYHLSIFSYLQILNQKLQWMVSKLTLVVTGQGCLTDEVSLLLVSFRTCQRWKAFLVLFYLLSVLSTPRPRARGRTKEIRNEMIKIQLSICLFAVIDKEILEIVPTRKEMRSSRFCWSKSPTSSLKKTFQFQI